MSRLLEALRAHATARPTSVFLHGGGASLDYARCLGEVEELADRFTGSRVGLLMDNHPAWAVADLATLAAHALCVPLPGFFTDRQIAHVIEDAGIDAVLSDQPQRVGKLWPDATVTPLRVADRDLYLHRRPPAGALVALPGIAKVTYTSGTTGEPRGVCLSLDALETVAVSLGEVTAAEAADASLALTPLSTLLENIGGVYVPLLAGARCGLPPLAEVGLKGAAALDVPAMLSSLARHQPTSAILAPQMLQALVEALEAGAGLPASLRFLAVGGAPVAETVLARARELGLPVYEGYGLSEAASVVTLNRPTAHRPGSVGRPLPHARVRIAGDGEVYVAGALLSGYLGEAPTQPRTEWATGDLGYLDGDGFLHLTGRKKNVFITAFGRNVAPEWVESELLAHPALAQAFVFGEARPFNVALLVPRPGMPAAAVLQAVTEANDRLPDYARVGRFDVLDSPFTPTNGQLTGTGRLRREAIQREYRGRIDRIYAEVSR
jgi:long-subunit acyl-CoA synthetase (AMP-forming)